MSLQDLRFLSVTIVANQHGSSHQLMSAGLHSMQRLIQGRRSLGYVRASPYCLGSIALINSGTSCTIGGNLFSIPAI